LKILLEPQMSFSLFSLYRGASFHLNLRRETPLHLAASSGYTTAIQIMIETHQPLIDQAEQNGVSI